MKPVTATVCIIATGDQYAAMAATLVEDLKQFFLTEDPVQVLLFTDRERSIEGNHRVRLEQIDQAALPWPGPTLQRYAIMNRAARLISGEWVLYLDADMRVVAPLGADLKASLASRSLWAVAHPGYWGRGLARSTWNRLNGGPWESRRDSEAYITRRMRGQYVCGGTQSGLRENYMSACR